MGGRKLSDERQIPNLSESANELIRLMQSDRFRIDKPTRPMTVILSSGTSETTDSLADIFSIKSKISRLAPVLLASSSHSSSIGRPHAWGREIQP